MSKFKKHTSEELGAISEFAWKLQAAKLKEATARQDRIAIEAKIEVLLPGDESDQRTIKLPDGRKITVERGLLYKADVAKIEAMRVFGPKGLHSPIKSKTTRSLDVTGYKWYEKNMPEVYAEIAELVSVKPAKTAITIKQAGAK